MAKALLANAISVSDIDGFSEIRIGLHCYSSRRRTEAAMTDNLHCSDAGARQCSRRLPRIKATSYGADRDRTIKGGSVYTPCIHSINVHDDDDDEDDVRSGTANCVADRPTSTALAAAYVL